jgi:tRNA threonylcarbamoyladenosine modification (KEOPS) complex  Pcc1 subunit
MKTVNYEIELNVEELEEVIAPALTQNHNETLDVDLNVEELEEVIAPALSPNHNETLVADAE